MSDSTLYTVWGICLVVAAVVVLLASGLLLLILKAARDIRANALRCLGAVEAIAQNTDPIWALQETNRVAEELLERSQSIERRAYAPAGVLGGSALAGDCIRQGANDPA
ncbi:MAG: hypothetical protein ACR2PL_04155, partial [Dehalococcoidia bacterium]